MNRGFAGALVLISGIAAPFTAHGASPSECTARTAPPTVNPEPQQREDAPDLERHWYGWQTLSTDAAWIGMVTLGASIADGASDRGSSSSATGVLLGITALGYLGGGPTVHFLHHNPGRGIASISLRAGLPLVSGLSGYAAENCRHPSDDDDSLCGFEGAVVGGMIGLVSAVTIDALVLSWEERPPSAADERAAGPQLGFTPVISSDGKRGELRLFGTF